MVWVVGVLLVCMGCCVDAFGFDCLDGVMLGLCCGCLLLVFIDFDVVLLFDLGWWFGVYLVVLGVRCWWFCWMGVFCLLLNECLILACILLIWIY